MYSSVGGGILPEVDPRFGGAMQPLLMNNKVDLVFFGHVDNYERTCALYQNECNGMTIKDKDGVDTYDNHNYSAPVHVIIGMVAGAEALIRVVSSVDNKIRSEQ